MRQLTFFTALVLLASCSKTNFSKTESGLATDNSEIQDLSNDSEPEAEPEAAPVGASQLTGPTEIIVAEEDGQITIEYEFNAPLQTDQLFKISSKDNTATKNQDYQLLSDEIIAEAGDETIEIRLQITNDQLWDVQDTESFELHVESESLGTAITTVNIQDDEKWAARLRDTVFDNPQGTTPNAVILEYAPDQDFAIKLRSDATVSEAQSSPCGTYDSTRYVIALPTVHYQAVQATDVYVNAGEYQSTDFMTTWLNVPSDSQGRIHRICFHVVERYAL